MLWMLVAYSTVNDTDVRYRVYTRSYATAAVFERIPKMPISIPGMIGHGVVFAKRSVPQKTYPEICGSRSCRDYIQQHATHDINGKRITWK